MRFSDTNLIIDINIYILIIIIICFYLFTTYSLRTFLLN
jgi:hypothetical protein